jgi:hypothetical protein
MDLRRQEEALELGSVQMKLRKAPGAQLRYELDVGPHRQSDGNRAQQHITESGY